MSAELEGFGALIRHVIVSQLVELDTGGAGEATPTTEADSQESAFLRLAHHNLDASYRLARAILRDAAEAEDATHDAFVQAWGKWPTLRDRDRFEPWFTRILINTCRDRLRRTSRRNLADVSALSRLPERADPIGQATDRDELVAALGHLSADHAVVVVLRFYRDMTIDQISRQLGVREGTVNSRLHYALKRLNGLLKLDEGRGR
jgi:RNA polymerase sigma-70 factor, ECF subfamily